MIKVSDKAWEAVQAHRDNELRLKKCLEYLICPKCAENLNKKSIDADDDEVTYEYSCPSCGLKYKQTTYF